MIVNVLHISTVQFNKYIFNTTHTVLSAYTMTYNKLRVPLWIQSVSARAVSGLLAHD